MKTSAFFAVIAGCVSAAFSQAQPEYLKTKALSFDFNGLYLSGVNGGVGGKLWLSDRTALTLGVDGSHASRLLEAEDTTEIDDELSSSSLNLSVGLERHVDLGRGFSPYLAGGVSVGFGREERNYGFAALPFQTRSRYTALGVNAGVGIEYWLTHRVSLAGQQLLAVTCNFGTSGDGSNSSDTRYLNLGLGTSALILSVYM